jgi:hypothetical protein
MPPTQSIRIAIGEHKLNENDYRVEKQNSEKSSMFHDGGSAGKKKPVLLHPMRIL